MGGHLSGIARHDRPKGPTETVNAVSVTREVGVTGCYRGALAAQKRNYRRQVSLIEAESWAAALADVGTADLFGVEWHHSRRNLLLSGIRLPRATGTMVAVGRSLIIEILDECDPCERMEAIIPGLRAAMTPDWRGGFLGRVVQDGDIALSDEIRIL